MEALLKSISQHAAELVLLLLSVVFVLSVMLVRLFGQLAKSQAKWKELLCTSNGETVERLLYDHLKERMAQQELLRRSEERIAELEDRMKTSKRHLGLVRFDAFEDVGGAQSFSLALFDDQGDGAILSSLLGREDCRVYCKTLSRGRTERNLSQEEQRAIEEARSSDPKPIVS